MLTTSVEAPPRERLGGVAALYLALAYVAAMPFFLLLVDYPAAETPSEKLALITAHHDSLYAMYVITYVLFGVALAALVLSLAERMGDRPGMVGRLTTFLGLAWSVALILSGMVFTFGMSTVVSVADRSLDEAAAAWLPIEAVAQGLGGAGGEILGGLWMLLLSTAALRSRSLPVAIGWLGVVTGSLGVASAVPGLHALSIGFGLLQIVWFAGVGVVLLRD